MTNGDDEQSDNLRQLPDVSLVERGLAARTEEERRRVEYEMWRRQNMLSQRATLVTEDTGRGGEVAGRGALLLALVAVILSLGFALSTDTNSAHRVWYVTLGIIVSLAAIPTYITLWATVRERVSARRQLREFDDEHKFDAFK